MAIRVEGREWPDLMTFEAILAIGCRVDQSLAFLFVLMTKTSVAIFYRFRLLFHFL